MQLKYTNPDPATFIIYRVAIPNTSGELEIMVTKDQRKHFGTQTFHV